MLKSVLLGTVAAIGAVGVSFAGDLPTKSSPATPVMKVNKTNWTGMYIGVGGGMNFYNPDMEGHIYETDATPDYIVEDDLQQTLANADAEGSVLDLALLGTNGSFGGLGTGEVGFDYQLSQNMVLGLVANYDFGAAKSDESVSASDYGFDAEGFVQGVEISSEIGNSWGVGARLGALVSDTTLVYGLAGYSMADISVGGRVFGGPIGSEMSMGIQTSGWQSGYFVGGGVETMLASNLSLKVEYRYSQYEGQNVWTALDDCEGDCSDDRYWSAAEVSNEDPSTHAIRAVLALRFSGL